MFWSFILLNFLCITGVILLIFFFLYEGNVFFISKNSSQKFSSVLTMKDKYYRIKSHKPQCTFWKMCLAYWRTHYYRGEEFTLAEELPSFSDVRKWETLATCGRWNVNIHRVFPVKPAGLLPPTVSFPLVNEILTDRCNLINSSTVFNPATQSTACSNFLPSERQSQSVGHFNSHLAESIWRHQELCTRIFH